MTQIIAFAGRKQSGKTTACQFVAGAFVNQKREIACIYNFADPLKDMCQKILGLTHEQCYGTDHQKNELVNCYWDGKQLSAREVMQIVGTDMFRRLQHNVWADATIRKILDEQLPLALVADCRFPNEVDAIKNAGGMVIKLNRNPFNSTHTSETALDANQYDQKNFDLIIDHNVTIDQKQSMIKTFLNDKGILSL